MDAVNDEIQEHFLNEIFLQLQYETFTPGQVLLNFSDAADRLLIFVSGQVLVEFEHPTIVRPKMKLKDGDYIGDLAILGEDDWAMSTCFHLPPHEVDTVPDRTEIKVSTMSHSFVVVLQLTREAFDTTLQKAHVVTQQAVDEFLRKWHKTRENILNDDDPTQVFSMEMLRAWEDIAYRIKKKKRRDTALEEKENKKNKAWESMPGSVRMAAKKSHNGSHVRLGTHLHADDEEESRAPASPLRRDAEGVAPTAQLQEQFRQLEERMDERHNTIERRLDILHEAQSKILATVMRLDASMSTEHKQKRRQSDRHLEDLITEADEATRDT